MVDAVVRYSGSSVIEGGSCASTRVFISSGSVMLGFSIMVACILGRVIAYTGRLRGGGGFHLDLLVFIFFFLKPNCN